jgi:hypothetical protein
MNQKTLLTVAVVLYAASAIGSYAFFSGSIPETGNYKPPATASNGTADVGPKTEECPLNGALYSDEAKNKWEKRRPLGIMVENSLDSRPQSGITQADVVYELVAEGGITRFLLVYYCQEPKIVGPVRSARIYFIRLLQGYGAYPLYAHVGGANTPGPADALGEINELGWVTQKGSYNGLNQFSVPFPNFYRDYDRLPGVATEHTMYTDTTKLWKFAAGKKLTNKDEDGVPWDKSFTPWKFQDDAKASERGDTAKISYDFWSQSASNYGVSWAYDVATNSYKRSNGGKPHNDKNNSKQITAKNVIVVLSEESPANDGYEGGHLLYDLTGSGTAYIFQNGDAFKGSWNKADFEDSMIFEDAKGNEIEMVRGQVFVSVIPTGSKVTY